MALRAVFVLSLVLGVESKCSLRECKGWSANAWNSSGLKLRGHDVEVGLVEHASDCVRCFGISLHDALVTFENLYFGQAQAYAFTDIVRNSTASVQNNKCNLQVHDLQVDVQAGLVDIYRDMIAPAVTDLGLDANADLNGLSPEKLYRLMTQDSGVAAIDFHSRLHSLICRLQDAHTLYSFQSMIFQFFPVTFAFEPCAGEDGRFVVTAASAPKAVASLNLHGHSRTLSRAAPSRVALINGRDPLEWLQERADKIGTYHDQAQRLNSLLLSAGLLGNKMDGIVELVGWQGTLLSREEASVTITFADGKTEVVDWAVGLQDSLLQDAFYTPDQHYVTFQQYDRQRMSWETNRTNECRHISGCEAAGAVSMGAARAYRHALGHLDAALLEAAALLAAEATQPARPQESPPPVKSTRLWLGRPHLDEASQPHAEDSSRFGCSDAALPAVGDYDGVSVVYAAGSAGPAGTEEFVTSMIVGDMAIYKITSMGESGMGDVTAAIEAFMALSNRSKAAGVKRVLVDLVSNGGGFVMLTDILQSLFLKDYEPKTVCRPYNKRVSEYWSKWVQSFGVDLNASIGRHIDELKKSAREEPVEVVRWYAKWSLKYLHGVVAASLPLLSESGGYNYDIMDLERVVDRVTAAPDVNAIVGVVEPFLKEHAFIPTSLYGAVGDLSTGQGWFPFTGSEIDDTETMKPFPNMSGILDPMTEHWGGVLSNYSKRGIFELGFGRGCLTASDENIKQLAKEGILTPAHVDALLAGDRDHPWEEIAMVSDGLCGSAGSAFPSKLLGSGYATMFTYGGKGDPYGMDSSAFEGGNVLEYDSWWPQVAVAAEMGMWLLPNSEWEQHARVMDTFADKGNGQPATAYPRPMPLKSASARFNFNIGYVREVSDSTSLPRQFYRFPAHRHFSVWHKHLQYTCANPNGLLHLYRSIYESDWWAARKQPQFVQGWGGACIPDESKRCLTARGASCNTARGSSWPVEVAMKTPSTCAATVDIVI